MKPTAPLRNKVQRGLPRTQPVAHLCLVSDQTARQAMPDTQNQGVFATQIHTVCTGEVEGSDCDSVAPVIGWVKVPV